MNNLSPDTPAECACPDGTYCRGFPNCRYAGNLPTPAPAPERAEVCGKCRLPIHPAEAGVRHFGLFRAHQESRCVDLLIERIEGLQNIATDALEFIEQYEDVVDYGEGRQGPNRAMSLAQELRRALGEKP